MGEITISNLAPLHLDQARDNFEYALERLAKGKDDTYEFFATLWDGSDVIKVTVEFIEPKRPIL